MGHGTAREGAEGFSRGGRSEAAPYGRRGVADSRAAENAGWSAQGGTPVP